MDVDDQPVGKKRNREYEDNNNNYSGKKQDIASGTSKRERENDSNLEQPNSKRNISDKPSNEQMREQRDAFFTEKFRKKSEKGGKVTRRSTRRRKSKKNKKRKSIKRRK